MNSNKGNKFFLLVGFKKIKFAALNVNNKILLDKELLINDLSLSENFKTLENFLEKNFFDLEKKLNDYINEINLIINYDDFLTVDVSTIKNFNSYIGQPDSITNFLLNIKDNVIKDMEEYDLIHMIINKFIIDGSKHSSIKNYKDYENMLLEIRFICLKSNILSDIKKIFSKYEITIKNTFCYEYVNQFKKSETDNIFDLTNKLISGLNQNEILFANKPIKSRGFFEKFFNLFS